MRRLPIYFLIDVSESMVGEPIEYVQNGMRDIITELRVDPYALETACVSVIEFAGRPQTVSPLTELYKFYPPKLNIGGGTNLGSALDYLMCEIDKNIQKTTAEAKGDWKPIVFLFTDGAPTDDPNSAISQWNSKYRKGCNLIAITLGENVDTLSLTKLTDSALQLKDTTPQSFKEFFKWVTASIKTTSVSVTDGYGDDIKLAPIDGINLEKIEHTSHKKVDDNYIIIQGKCQSTKERYLIKYGKKQPAVSELEAKYGLIGAYRIDESMYSVLSVNSDKKESVNLSSTVGIPACPCCGNQNGLVICECGGVFCVGEQRISTCPWCGMEGELTAVASNELNIDRTIG
ncbi:MAG: TerY-C metal binding domain-containing protein [Rikenellaceae bacterium]